MKKQIPVKKKRKKLTIEYSQFENLIKMKVNIGFGGGGYYF